MMKIKPSLWALMLTTLTLLGCNNEDSGLLGGGGGAPSNIQDFLVTPEIETTAVGFTENFQATAV
ncbi:hypothetical protein, partial [Vibrio owensii]|uniref:hypothetical protein n=1 Tax=Vibrio owensii TaxID=696485 RepID=UPI003DA114D2